MNEWDAEEFEGAPRGHVGRHINKEKYCKKNKLGHGQYGPHIYENKHCKLCGKTDPSTKFKPTQFIKEDTNNE